MEKEAESGGVKLKELLYKKLPPKIEKLGHKIGLQKVSSKYVRKFLKETIPESRLGDIEEFKKYVFSFEKYNVRKKKQPKKKTLLNAYQQRKLAVFKMDPKITKFDVFIPLHDMWKQHMETILMLKEGGNLKDEAGVYQKLIKADYNGAMLVVASSKCPSYVGLRGIVLQETRNIFRLITPDDKIKTIPKMNTVFAFKLQDKIFQIYGNNFRFLPQDKFWSECRVKYQ